MYQCWFQGSACENNGSFHFLGWLAFLAIHCGVVALILAFVADLTSKYYDIHKALTKRGKKK